ncbi:MAG TPA: hypothetical protein VNM66_09670 [Thermodesulfobacteriota bacterium]|nr:hypothetical protein [Thermodesulfobacteriota bacterium]
MRQLWLVLGFLVLMLLIGHGWREDSLGPGLAAGEPRPPTVTPAR